MPYLVNDWSVSLRVCEVNLPLVICPLHPGRWQSHRMFTRKKVSLSSMRNQIETSEILYCGLLSLQHTDVFHKEDFRAGQFHYQGAKMTLASSTKMLASISCFCNGQGPVSVLNIVTHTHTPLCIITMLCLG